MGKVAYKPGIETMEAFDARLGHPHRKFRSVHIAGTNGKGSTSHTGYFCSNTVLQNTLSKGVDPVPEAPT